MGWAYKPASCSGHDGTHEPPSMHIEDALLLQEALDPYNTGSKWVQMKPEDSLSMFPTYSEADKMLKRKARAKKGSLLLASKHKAPSPHAETMQILYAGFDEQCPLHPVLYLTPALGTWSLIVASEGTGHD